MKKRLLFIFLLFFIVGCSPAEFDPYSKDNDFSSVIEQNGLDKEEFIENTEAILKTTNELFSRGDYFLILSRFKDSNSNSFLAMDFFHKQIETTDDVEEKAILFETIASIDDHKYHFMRAADNWRKAGDMFRAKLDFKLAFRGDIDWEFDIEEMEEADMKEAAEKIIVGNSRIELNKDDLIVVQADRVTRNWISHQIQHPYSDNLLTVSSDVILYDDGELQEETGWHEGARLKEMKNIGLDHKVVIGTILKKHHGMWYAPNEEGVFMFEVPEDKVLYPTTRFLRKDIAVVIDTHGINMLVAHAIKNNATAVMGCCDDKGNIKAAKYLSDKGIKVICNTDKYVPLLLGSDADVLGSAPFKVEDGSLIIGNRPVEISLDEPVIVMDTVSKEQGMSYYSTPSLYFSELEKKGIKLNTFIVEVNDFNQMDKVIRKAKSKNSKIIAVRVFNSDDYSEVKGWLEENPDHKVMLFHSEAYPFGYKLAREFKSQTTFDDINPVII